MDALVVLGAPMLPSPPTFAVLVPLVWLASKKEGSCKVRVR